METRENKVLVNYNYYQLEQQKKACARVSDMLLEKTEEIKQHNRTIKFITREACNYVEEVHAATNKIHGLAGIALDLAASMSVCNLKQAILEIRDAVVALQNTTATTCLSLQQKDISLLLTDTCRLFMRLQILGVLSPAPSCRLLLCLLRSWVFCLMRHLVVCCFACSGSLNVHINWWKAYHVCLN